MNKFEAIASLTLISSMILSACGGKKPSSEISCNDNRAVGFTNRLTSDLSGTNYLSIIPKMENGPLDNCIQIQTNIIEDQHIAVLTLTGDPSFLPSDILYQACQQKFPPISNSPEGEIPFIDQIKTSVCIDWAQKGIPVTLKIGASGDEVFLPVFLIHKPTNADGTQEMPQIALKLTDTNQFVEFGSEFGNLPLADIIQMLKVNLRSENPSKKIKIVELFPHSYNTIGNSSETVVTQGQYVMPEFTPTLRSTDVPPTYTPTVTMTPTATMDVGNHSPEKEDLPLGYPIESNYVPETGGGSLILTIQPNKKLTYHSFVTQGQDNGAQEARLKAMLENPTTDPKAITGLLSENEEKSKWAWLQWFPNLIRRSRDDVLKTVIKEKVSGGQLILKDYSVIIDGDTTYAFGINPATGRYSYMKITSTQIINNQLEFTAPSLDGQQPNIDVVAKNLANLLTYAEGNFPTQELDGHRLPTFMLMDSKFTSFFSNFSWRDMDNYVRQANEKSSTQPIFIINTTTGALIPISFPTGIYFEFKGFHRDIDGKEYVLGYYNFTQGFPRELVTEEEGVALNEIYLAQGQATLFAIPKEMVLVADPAFYTKVKKSKSNLPTPSGTPNPASYVPGTGKSGMTIVIEKVEPAPRVITKSGTPSDDDSNASAFHKLALKRGLKRLAYSYI